jgi:hypothetical protein
MIDDLWATGLANLVRLREYDQQAAARARLLGRDLDPWRMILAVALWLEQEHGLAGLFDRMEGLSIAYQQEREELDAEDDPIRLALRALELMYGQDEADPLIFETATLTATMKDLAEADGMGMSLGSFADERRAGWALKRLRLSRPPKGKNRRRWKISRKDLDDLLRAYGLTQGNAENADKAENANDEKEEEEEEEEEA